MTEVEGITEYRRLAPGEAGDHWRRVATERARRPGRAAALAHQFNTYPKGDWRYAPLLQERLEDFKAGSKPN